QGWPTAPPITTAPRPGWGEGTTHHVRAGSMNGQTPSSEVPHVPVLPAEVLAALAPLAGQTIVAATLATGGQARLLAERLGPTGRLVGVDQDAAMLALARPRLEAVPGGGQVNLVQANFDDLRAILNGLGVGAVDGVLADLGICSDQLDVAD